MNSARAITFYGSNPNPSGGDGPVNAGASFSISGDVVTIQLQNLIANPTGAGQLLSGLMFDISGATTTGTFGAAGNITTISAGGSYTAGTPSTLPHWQESSSGTTFNLNVFSGGPPNDMIIGPDSKGNFNPALGGLYNNATPSITGNHQPSVLGTATFTLTIPGVNPNSVISDVIFNFGTAPGEVTVPVPDNGATIALLGLGLSGVALLGRRFGRQGGA